MDPMTNPVRSRMGDPAMRAQRRARIEEMRRSRHSMLKWRWVMLALGALLAAALLASASYVIGGILAVLVEARLVMLTRMQRMWKEREAMWDRDKLA